MRDVSSELHPTPSDVTILLREVATGDAGALGRVVTLLYPDLKRIAERRMRTERSDHTLQPSALVSEFFVELANCRRIEWRNRSHFLAVASQMMRRFLIDYARSHNAARRGGGAVEFNLPDLHFASGDPVDLIFLNQVLDELERQEERVARVIELRCFGGLTQTEIAETIGVDERTIRRDWKLGRAWVRSRLERRSDA